MHELGARLAWPPLARRATATKDVHLRIFLQIFCSAVMPRSAADYQRLASLAWRSSPRCRSCCRRDSVTQTMTSPAGARRLGRAAARTAALLASSSAVLSVLSFSPSSRGAAYRPLQCLGRESKAEPARRGSRLRHARSRDLLHNLPTHKTRTVVQCLMGGATVVSTNTQLVLHPVTPASSRVSIVL